MMTAQIIQESLKTTVFGMGLVLSTLFVLSLILDLMKVFLAKKQMRKMKNILLKMKRKF